MINVNDFKTGVTILMDNNIYQVMEFQHVKPGKGAAFVRSKLRNLRSGAIVDHTFNAGIKVEKAHIEKNKMQYLYDDGTNLVFMDNATYDQIEIPHERLEWELKFLKESDYVEVTQYGSEVLGVELPNSVALTVVEAEPAVKGDTATSATKNVKMETGLEVRVPLFISEGEVLMINTTDGKYMGRA